MNLVLTKRGQYAVKAARALALAYDGEYHKTKEVVSKTDLPARFAPQVLADLREAGITEARAGPAGGHRLSRPPRDISLLEVVNAAEHTLIESRCMITGKACPPAENCFVHPVWAAAQTALLESLETATLSDLVAEEGLPDEDEPLGATSIAAAL